MTVFLFQKEFVPKILDGTKTHTIRPERKRLVPPGEMLSLRHWAGTPYRSRQVSFMHTYLLGSQPIELHGGGPSGRGQVRYFTSFLSGLPCGELNQPEDLDAFAVADGFSDWMAMRNWFRTVHGLPFSGRIYHWKPAPTPVFTLLDLREALRLIYVQRDVIKGSRILFRLAKMEVPKTLINPHP